ncbi:hypothetical protein BDP27DRAFT_1333920 [Rhodocollybia butyracea]|uniref:Uncharacterized protein n=1 Tax=Rhodocollybia butyracea TaxID=206335 RepID=A0A9P5PJ20_9AGAR|nr:hypothetical protein BDP27DRAFT_1333920 [Rhodocollybia butyracea]
MGCKPYLFLQQAAIALDGTSPQNPSGTVISVSVITTAVSTPTSALTTNITPSMTTSSCDDKFSFSCLDKGEAGRTNRRWCGSGASSVYNCGLSVFIRIRRRKAARTRILIDLTDEDIPLTPSMITALPQMETLASSNKANSPRRTRAALDNKIRTEESRNLGLSRPFHVENTDARLKVPVCYMQRTRWADPLCNPRAGETSNDLTEEGALLRELQIIRRLEEIHLGDVVPPPEYK